MTGPRKFLPRDMAIVDFAKYFNHLPNETTREGMNIIIAVMPEDKTGHVNWSLRMVRRAFSEKKNRPLFSPQ